MMTNEEAKDILQSLKFIIDDYGDRIEDAIDMAIKALNESRQRGEWIEIENGVYVCSFCKNQIEALIPPENCPYCSADMKGGGE